jgi:hypothetical protein
MKLLRAIARVILPPIAFILVIGGPFLFPMLLAYFLGEIAGLHPILTWIFNPITIWVVVIVVTLGPFVAIEYFSDNKEA